MESARRKLCQLKYEVDSWKRILEFIRHENIQVKNHLAEVVRLSDGGQYFLDDVEHLLNNLLQIEIAVNLTSNDIMRFEKLFNKESGVNETYKDLGDLRYTINRDIRKVESEFNKAKHEVDTFLFIMLLS